MATTLRHRGPDDSGTWVDEEAGIALGFRRLSIVDLSPQGHQPMHSRSARYTIVFNGEVYNFQSLRAELEKLGNAFRGNSDTEVLLSAVEEWGLEAAVERCVGMFAFALWDAKTRRLYLVRDRLGKKPMYYGMAGSAFIFGSELKALHAHPGFHPDIDRRSVVSYLIGNYIPGPYSIYEGVRKLPPGSILSLSAPQSNSEPVRYWSLKEIAERGTRKPFPGTEDEAVAELDRILRDAVRLRMVADVPLGAFLSGGVDSSTIVALMQACSPRPVKTFSIGFHEQGFDEAEHARAVASYLHSDHTELYLAPEEAQSVIPLMPEMYDEPFADPAQIPTYLVSRLAREHVTVGLTGDGGDELFGGYDTYSRYDSTWGRLQRVPVPARRFLGHLFTAVSPTAWDHALGPIGAVMPSRFRRFSSGDRFHRAAGLLAIDHWEDVYTHIGDVWPNAVGAVVGAGSPRPFTTPDQWAALPGRRERMMFVDLLGLIPDDFLVKVDRASMAVSLEARVPLLDHRVVEFAAGIPLSMKIRGEQGKWLLRRLLDKHVPARLVDRPKQGFSVPIGAWLRGPLRDWAECLLDEDRLRSDGIFDPCSVRTKWTEHKLGTRDHHKPLWQVLMFQAWFDVWHRGA